MLGATFRATFAIFRATFFGTLASGALLAGPVVAADLPVKAPIKPSAPAAYNWTGVYIGANVGGGWGRKNWTFVTAIPSGCGGLPSCPFDEGGHNADGWLAGGQIGFDWQAGRWVLGAELMWDWADLSGQHNNPAASGNDILRSQVDSIGLITGRVGYTWDSLLFYGKGGAAWARDKYERALGNDTFGAPGTVFATASERRWGWTAGAGLEYGFAPNWSAAVEYDFVGLGTRRLRFAITPAFPSFSPLDEDIRQDLHLLTFRVNYRFGASPFAGR